MKHQVQEQKVAHGRSGSQTNREKLYKRFKKLVRSYPSQGLEKTQSQKNIASCQYSSGQEQQEMRPASAASLAKLGNYPESQAYLQTNQPYHQPQATSNAYLRGKSSDSEQKSLSLLREQFKRPNSKGRNQTRVQVSTNLAHHGPALGPNPVSSSYSNLPASGTLDEGQLTMSSGQNRSNVRQALSSRTLQADNSVNSAQRNSGAPTQLGSALAHGFNFGAHKQLTQNVTSSSSARQARGLDQRDPAQVQKQGQRQVQGAEMRVPHNQYMSQSSQNSSSYPIQFQKPTYLGPKTNQNSLKNFKDGERMMMQQRGRPGTQKCMTVAEGQEGVDQFVQNSISVQSEMDLNPLNDSHIFHVSNQRPQHAVQAWPFNAANLNQSSVAQNEAANHSKFEATGEEVPHSDSSLWLPDEFATAQNEHRVRQHPLAQHYIVSHANPISMPRPLYHDHQPYAAEHFKTEAGFNRGGPGRPKPLYATGDSKVTAPALYLNTQDSETVHHSCQFASTCPHQMCGNSELQHLSRHATNHPGSGQPLQPRRFSAETHSAGLSSCQLQALGTQQIQAQACCSHPACNLQLQHIDTEDNMQTGFEPQNESTRPSHHLIQPWRAQGEPNANSLRASFQGPLPSQVFNNQLQFGAMAQETGNKRTERSQQVSVAYFGDFAQLQGIKKGLEARQEFRNGSERNCPLNRPGNASWTQAALDGDQNKGRQRSVDQSVSHHHFEKGKHSTRTNPYSNLLLNSNFVGSTAPSANVDQLTTSQVNSCSQFAPASFQAASTLPVSSYPAANSIATAGRTFASERPGCSTQNLPLSTTEAYVTSSPDVYQLKRQVQEASGAQFGKFLPISMQELVDNTHAEQEPPREEVQTTYTNQVAQQLLAQVRPGILRLIQSRIDAIVGELSEEGLYDQKTILKVLEHRASKLFPENFLASNEKPGSSSHNDTSNLGQNLSDLLDLTSVKQASKLNQSDPTGRLHSQQALNQHQRDEVTSNSEAGFSGLLLSQANLSNNEIPMARQTYSDTLAISELQQQNESQRQQNMTLNLLQSLQKAQATQGTSLTNEEQQELLRHLQQLNSTEEIIQAMQHPASPDKEHFPIDASSATLSVQSRPTQPPAQADETTRAELDLTSGNLIQEAEAQQDDALNTDRLMNDIRSSTVAQQQAQGRNFKSRKAQKSDQFKITFAYTSQRSSADMDQVTSYGGLSQQQYQKRNSIQSQAEAGPVAAQPVPDNLLSFNRNEKSPDAHMPLQDQRAVVENIKLFSRQKQDQVEQPDWDKEPEVRNGNPRQAPQFDEQQIAQLYYNMAGPSVDQSSLREDLPGDQRHPFLTERVQQQRPVAHQSSRNKKQGLDFHYTSGRQASVNAGSNIDSTIYQRTLASEQESEKRERHHMTQNSDLIDQIGNDFVYQTSSGPVYQPSRLHQQHAMHAESQQPPPACDQLATGNSFSTPEYLYQTQVAQRYNQLTNKAQLVNENLQQNQFQVTPPVSETLHQWQKDLTVTPEQPASHYPLGSFSVRPSEPNATQAIVTGSHSLTANEVLSSRRGNCIQGSEPVSKSSLALVEGQAARSGGSSGAGLFQGCTYDVNAEGSIINIKRNQAGDPEMLILSSQKELRDLMNTQQAFDQPALQHCPLPKAASRSRSRGRSKPQKKKNQSATQKFKSNRSTRADLRSKSASKRLRAAVTQPGSRMGIRKGNLMALHLGPTKKLLYSKTPNKSPRKLDAIPYSSQAGPKRVRQLNSRTLRSSSERRTGRVGLDRHRSEEGLSLKHVSTSPTLLIEKELLRSLQSMRRQNFAAKQELKAIYQHKLEKMRDELHYEKQADEANIREQLKNQRRATELHRRRAENFKATAQELTQAASARLGARKRPLAKSSRPYPYRHHGRRSTGFVSRSLSNQRSGSTEGEKTIFGALGCTYKPGFSFLSRSLPRNNHNFVQNKNASALQKPVTSHQTQNPSMAKNSMMNTKTMAPGSEDGVLIRLSAGDDSSRERFEAVRSESRQSASLELLQRSALDQGTANKDRKLGTDDRFLCRSGQQDSDEATVVRLVHTIGEEVGYSVKLGLSEGIEAAMESKQTFGCGELDSRELTKKFEAMDTMCSPKSFENFKSAAANTLHEATKTHKNSHERSIAEAVTLKGHKHQSSESSVEAVQQRQEDFVSQLQKSGARFKCTNCRARKVEVELPCVKCRSLNCHADQKNQRRNASATSELSWNSSDLNFEYQKSSRRHKKKDDRVFSSKLLQCSQDLLANQERLDQIQKILYKPKQPRQGHKRTRSSRRRENQRSGNSSNQQAASVATSYSGEPTNLPQMIDRLRESRRNIKF